MMHATAIIARLGSEIGIPSLALNEDGMCRVVFDDCHELDFEYNQSRNRFYVYSCAGKIPTDKREDLFEALLGANLYGIETGSASFAIDKNLNEVVLFLQYPAAEIAYDAFKSDLELFLHCLIKWKKKIHHVGEIVDPGKYSENANLLNAAIRV